MADGEYWDFLDEGGYDWGGDPWDTGGGGGGDGGDGGGDSLGDGGPVDFTDPGNYGDGGDDGGEYPGGIPGEGTEPGEMPEGWDFNGVTGNFEDPDGNQWQWNDTYGYVPADWQPLPEGFQYDNQGAIYDGEGNPMYLDDQYGWLPQAWQGGDGKFDPKLYEQATGDKFEEAKVAQQGVKPVTKEEQQKKNQQQQNKPSASAPSTGITQSPKGPSSSSGNSSLDSLGKGVGGLLSPVLGALGLSNSGSLNPSGDYQKGNVKQKTTYVGTDPTQSGAMGQLFNAYAAGAVGNQKLRDEILRGTPENPGLLSTLNQYQTNPVQDFGGGANEFSTLGTYNQFMSGKPTENEGFVTGGYKSAYEQPASPYDLAAGDVYSAAAGGPSEMAKALYQDTMAYGGPNAKEEALYGKTGAYGETISPDEAAMRGVYNTMIGPGGGYDAETQQNIRASMLEGARAPFENAERANERRALATGNQLVATVGRGGLARDQGQAMTAAGRQAELDIAKEAIRQREAGAAGLGNVLAASNARQQFGINAQAGQLGQQNQRLLAALNARQGQLGQQQQYQLAGASGLSNLGQNLFGRRMAGLQGVSGQNQLQRGYQLEGTKGAQDWYNQMFGRRMAGTTGLQNLWNTAQGADLAYLGGAANVGGRPIEQYSESGGQKISSTGGPNVAKPFFDPNQGKEETTTGTPYDPNSIDLDKIYGMG